MRLQKMAGPAANPTTSKPATAASMSSSNIVAAPAVPIGAEVVDFRGYFKVDVYPHNAAIYRPGETSDRVYLLKRGRVRLVRTGRGAARSVLAILRAGDLFGELTLGEGGATTEEMALATGEAEVWSIEGGEFRNLLEEPPLAGAGHHPRAERADPPAAPAPDGRDLQGGSRRAWPRRSSSWRDPGRALPPRRGDRPARRHPAGPGGPGGRLALVRVDAGQRDEARRVPGQRGTHPLHPRPEGAAQIASKEK
jgi:hypothetical protein